MAAQRKKKKKKDESGPSNDWMTTYGDMVTLLLCFFAVLFNPVGVNDNVVVQAIETYFQQYDLGRSLSVGRGQSGNTMMEFPSQTRGRSLADALRRAVAMFTPEIRSNQVRITHDERGVVISLGADFFFESASARVNLEAARSTLLNLAILLNSEEVAGRKIRIEGHTDDTPTDTFGPWGGSNWRLSTERALSVLEQLTYFGVPENRMQIAGFSDTVPVSSNSTPEGRAYNRRVDIIIIDDAHL